MCSKTIESNIIFFFQRKYIHNHLLEIGIAKNSCNRHSPTCNHSSGIWTSIIFFRSFKVVHYNFFHGGTCRRTERMMSLDGSLKREKTAIYFLIRTPRIINVFNNSINNVRPEIGKRVRRRISELGSL